MTLKELHIGQTGRVTAVGGEGALRQHFLDMGVIPGIDVKLVKYAPMGDPMQLLVHGYELTLRLADAEKIDIELQENPEPQKSQHNFSVSYGHEEPHPGYGEMNPLEGHTGEHKHIVNEKVTFALLGNQNSGKTTLFNQLTGANQHVGNFPGVTVDQKTGIIKGHPEATVTDLPGIYSLSPYSNEEIVSREFIFNAHPTCIINIVDASNIERNLYLTMQILELGIPTVLALNMMDEVRNNGGTILVNELESRLGIPVIPISALKNEGVAELVEHAIHVAKYNEGPARKDFCGAHEHGGAVHRAIHAMTHLIYDHAEKAQIPARFAATKRSESVV